MRKVNKSFQSFDWPATMTQWDQKNFEVTFKVLHPYKRFMRKFYQNCLHVIGVSHFRTFAQICIWSRTASCCCAVINQIYRIITSLLYQKYSFLCLSYKSTCFDAISIKSWPHCAIHTYVVRGKYKQASKKLQCCCMLLIFLMSLCYLSLSMLTSGSILLKAHISEDKFQNTCIQSGPPKVSYLSPLTASFLAPFACLKGQKWRETPDWKQSFSLFHFRAFVVRCGFSRTLHFYDLIEIWSEIIVGAARGDKKLTARGDKYDTFGVPGCTLYK